MTGQNLNTRIAQHLKISNNLSYYEKRKKAYPIHRALAKYGVNNFVIEELGTYNTHEDMCIAEIEFIKKFDALNKDAGYNLCFGGEGVIHTDEIRKKKSLSMIKLVEDGKLPQVKLNAEKAIEIKKLIMSGGFTNREIAKMYGVSFGNISCIQKNKIYKEALKDTPVLEHGKNGWYQPGYKNRNGTNNNQSKFSENDIQVIKKRYENGDAINDIANDYHVVRQTISRLIHKKSYN